MNLLETLCKRLHMKNRADRFYEYLMESAYHNDVPGLVHWIDDKYKIFNI